MLKSTWWPKKRPPRFAEKMPASVVLYDFWHTSGVLYCQLCSFQLHKIKFYIYTVSKKHITTFSKISWTRTVCLQWLLSDLLHVFLVSHFTYLVQLLYHGKLSRPKYLVSKNMCTFSKISWTRTVCYDKVVYQRVRWEMRLASDNSWARRRWRLRWIILFSNSRNSLRAPHCFHR